MYRNVTWLCCLCSIFLMPFAHAQADSNAQAPEVFCQSWFGQSARPTPLPLANTNVIIQEVSLGGQTSGWLFRTDQVPPVCKGKRGQIAVLVAVGTDARIKGLTVLAHKEDPRYFRRLKTAFFEQFRDRHADAPSATFEAVTQATLSSRAIIRDVTEGIKTVVAQPEIATKLISGKKGG